MAAKSIALDHFKRPTGLSRNSVKANLSRLPEDVPNKYYIILKVLTRN
jgi:hypothetical protein